MPVFTVQADIENFQARASRYGNDTSSASKELSKIWSDNENIAVQARESLISTLIVAFVPEQFPAQPSNWLSEAGAAVRRTVSPVPKSASQTVLLPAQEIPTGSVMTDPLPSTVTDNVSVEAG